jgi:ubiquinone/menaquinone biosynthesis C-methylase UbiE
MKKELFNKDIVELNDGIFEVNGLERGEYDAQANKYDKLIGNVFYNWLMWGNTPTDYSSFCKEAIEGHNGGLIVDVGCGTLNFTSKIYSKYPNQDLFLCDLSYEMLKLGKKRLYAEVTDLSKVTFLRSDALAMPFIDQSVQMVLSFGFLHVIVDPSKLLAEFNRMLVPKGKLYLLT